MLKGKELIAFIKAHPELGKTELARQSGYTRISEEGKEQIMLQAFFEASMAAHGTPIHSRGGAGGPRSKYRTTVHASGIMIVGRTYIKEFSAQPGDVFGIELREDGIWLPLLEEGPEVEAAPVAAPKAAPAAELELEDEDEDDLTVFDDPKDEDDEV
jgi:hypothetical protein